MNIYSYSKIRIQSKITYLQIHFVCCPCSLQVLAVGILELSTALLVDSMDWQSEILSHTLAKLGIPCLEVVSGHASQMDTGQAPDHYALVSTASMYTSAIIALSFNNYTNQAMPSRKKQSIICEI